MNRFHISDLMFVMLVSILVGCLMGAAIQDGRHCSRKTTETPRD